MGTTNHFTTSECCTISRCALKSNHHVASFCSNIWYMYVQLSGNAGFGANISLKERRKTRKFRLIRFSCGKGRERGTRLTTVPSHDTSMQLIVSAVGFTLQCPAALQVLVTTPKDSEEHSAVLVLSNHTH